MVAEHYEDKWRDRYFPSTNPGPPSIFSTITPISRQEFDDLKKEVEDLKALLIRAKAYDERNNEPDCEMEEKMDLLRKVAKMVGVSLDDVIGKGSA
jgi:hypothetical protein